MKQLIVALALTLSSVGAIAQEEVLEWELNPHVSAYLTGQPCPFEYKNKYPYMAFAVNVLTNAKLKGCYGRHDANDVIIHWHGTPDTIEHNSILPGNVFLKKMWEGRAGEPKALPKKSESEEEVKGEF